MLDSRDKSADVFQVKVSRRGILGELKTVIKVGSGQALENDMRLYEILGHEEAELRSYLGSRRSDQLLK